MYVVITTFDGIKPPSSYYEALRKIGIAPDRARIRTVASASVAAEMVRIAERYGGSAYAFPTSAALDVSQERLPGLLPESSGRSRNWVVTCYECARSFAYLSIGPAPRQCPVCASFAVHSRPGLLRPAIAPASAPPFTQWLYSRFFTGWLTFPNRIQTVSARDLEEPPTGEWKEAVDRVKSLGLATMEEMDAAICLFMYPFQCSGLRGNNIRELIYEFISRKRRR